MRHTIPLMIWLGAVCCLAAGCGRPQGAPGTAPAASGPAAAVAVRVGYFPNVTHAPAVLGCAPEPGKFAQALGEGVRLKPRVFNAGPEAMEALHARALDLCFVGPVPALNAFARGGQVALVANVADGGAVLAARRGSGLRSVADLAGKRIAIPQLGNTQDVVMRRLLAEAGLRLTDQGGNTSLLAVQNPDILALFQRGQLDAACVPEPWGARLEVEAGAELLLDEKALWRGGEYPVTVLVARRAFLEQHPELVQRLAAALDQIGRALEEDPQAQAAALNAELQRLTGHALAPEVLDRSLRRLHFRSEINLPALQEFAETLQQVGYARAVPDLAGFVAPGGSPPAAEGAGR